MLSKMRTSLTRRSPPLALVLSSWYRVTILDGKNLPLTLIWHLQQILGQHYSYLLPWQDGGTPQIEVNKKFSQPERVAKLS